jgi:aspartyl-tRNA(Asn)/glutamyl-tRNA(Gln) amidotransferase subunit A
MSDDEMAHSDQSSRLQEHPEDSTIKDISRRDFIQTSAAGLLTSVPHLSSSSGLPQRAPTPADLELCFMPATVLAAEIRAKKISPVEVIDAVYARLHEINPKINAFCTLTEEQAHSAAKESEAAVMRGDQLGALHGVPVSIKDLLLTRGVRTMYGSRIRENYIPEEDAPSVAKVLAAGAILIGKTTTPEHGFKAVTDCPLTGVTRNPWNLNKTCGGSSGGAGAAIAAGLGPLGIGTDAGGSIRIPCSFNGIFGLKPSFGRVAAYAPSPVPFLVHVGPMTRTVRDAALMLTAMAGPDERDLLSLPADATDYLAACDRGIRGLRVAWSATLGYAKVEPEVAHLTQAAASVFESDLGCNVEAVDPEFGSPWSFFSVLWVMSCFLRLHAFLKEWESRMDPDLVKVVKQGERLASTDYAEALAKRSVLWETTRKFFDRYDLLLMPTLPVPPFDVGRIAPETVSADKGLLPFGDWIPFTYPWNLTGQPAASVPCGFTREGLPVGLQIVGRRFADAMVLRAASAFEQARPWAHARPF